MAISQTMSNSSEWLLPAYQTDFSTAVQVEVPPTITTVHSTNTAAAARSAGLIPAADHGRISKPVRRRSRASRRTPTTLLNTDATNFRAMVQQFTGGPAARFAATTHVPAGAMLGFAPQPTASPASGLHAQYHQNQVQHVYAMDGANHGGFPPQSAAEMMNRSDYGNYMMLQ